MSKMTKTEMVAELNYCFETAALAACEYIQKNPNQWYPCGFSWVVIRDGRSMLAKVLKESFGASKMYGERGIQVWNPSDNSTQWMDAKLEGSIAFANALIGRGLVEPEGVSYASRMD